MQHRPITTALLAVLLTCPFLAPAQEEATLPTSVTNLFEKAKPSVVVISVDGRTGSDAGVGTGFIIDSDGLVVTNRHVIGEGRAISIQLADGRSVPVESIYATSNRHDLAILKIDEDELPSLTLGDSAAVGAGEPVIAIGNPHGLSHSVVAGVVSAKREIDGMPMIQVAMPIEPGNSGGPLLDREGRVVGIITMKSLVKANIGFAIESDALEALLAKPNPVPMTRWQTIGALDSSRWQSRLGATWQQRAGRIIVKDPGTGFGGRSLCLWHAEPPEAPYEVAVNVRLDDESGAAGLVFASDRGDRHYGFYPSGGSLRLTRFDGPDVFTWTILADVPSEHYAVGDWNHLKVRVEPDRIRCFVNDRLVIESRDLRFRGTHVGLTKFRDTEATFRRFEVAETIAPTGIDEAMARDFSMAVEQLEAKVEMMEEAVMPFLSHPEQSVAFLRQEARRRQREAGRLRQLAERVHEAHTRTALIHTLDEPEESIDLVQAALLVARLDNDEVDVEGYLADIDRMASDIIERFPPEASDQTKLAALNKFLFEDHGYHGSRGDYYHRSNSYMNEVIDDREGLPITLSILYMELAKRLGVRVVGVGMPGHFIVRHEPSEGEDQLIDVFDRAKNVSVEKARTLLEEADVPDTEIDEYLATPRSIIARMMNNLLGSARRERDVNAMRRYLEVMVLLSPDDWVARWQRGVVLLELGERSRAAEDAQWLMEHPNPDLDQAAVHRLFELATNGPSRR